VAAGVPQVDLALLAAVLVDDLHRVDLILVVPHVQPPWQEGAARKGAGRASHRKRVDHKCLKENTLWVLIPSVSTHDPQCLWKLWLQPQFPTEERVH